MPETNENLLGAPEPAPETPADMTPETPATEPAPETPAQAPEIAPEDMPITEWSNDYFGLPKDTPISEELAASFGKAAVEMGLSQKQAKMLASWNMQAVSEGLAARMEAEGKALNALWGRNAQANKNFINAQLGKLDSIKGLEGFSESLAKSGALNNAKVVNGLLYILKRFGEDGGAMGAAASQNDGPETALEGIRRAFAEARARQ